MGYHLFKQGANIEIPKKEFKYTAKFHSNASFNFLKPESQKEISATLDHLKTLLPDDQEYLKKNDDLIFTAFDLFTANLANKNGDCVLKEDAIAIANGFVNRFADLEHNRWNIVGHANKYAYSTFGEDEPKIYTEDEVNSLGEFDLFNVSLGAVIYKLVDPYFAEFVKEEASNPNSPYYNTISASFEIGFDGIWIAVGSPNMKDATIVKDKEEVEKLIPYLISEGGTGYNKDGQPLYRIARNPKALGFGYVEFPAGSVKGVVVANSDKKEEENKLAASVADTNENNDLLDEIKKINDKIEVFSNNFENNNKFDKKEDKISVNKIQAKRKIMIKSIDDIQQDQMAELAASDVRTFFKEQVQKSVEDADKTWNEKLTKEIEAKEALEKAKADLESELSTQAKQIEDLTKEINELKAAEAEAKQEQNFQDRMSLLDEEYNFDKDQRAVVAKAVRGIDSDEDFNSWKESFDIIAKNNSKDKSNEAKATESLASVDKTVGNAGVPNTPSENTNLKSEDFLKKLQQSFASKQSKLNRSKVVTSVF